MRRLYTIETPGLTLASVGGIKSPLLVPTEMDPDDIIRYVRKGAVVYQHNPVDKSEKVRVTPQNVMMIEFSTTKSQAVRKRIALREMHELEKSMKTGIQRKVDTPAQQNNNKNEKPVEYNRDNNKKHDNKNNAKAEEKAPVAAEGNDFAKN